MWPEGSLASVCMKFRFLQPSLSSHSQWAAKHVADASNYGTQKAAQQGDYLFLLYILDVPLPNAVAPECYKVVLLSSNTVAMHPPPLSHMGRTLARLFMGVDMMQFVAVFWWSAESVPFSLRAISHGEQLDMSLNSFVPPSSCIFQAVTTMTW